MPLPAEQVQPFRPDSKPAFRTRFGSAAPALPESPPNATAPRATAPAPRAAVILVRARAVRRAPGAASLPPSVVSVRVLRSTAASVRRG
ncbi:hypothetical protein GCM10023079_35790 [Streptomyces chitinivorans]